MPETQKSLSITVVVPAYNEELHLVACLDSLACQSLKPDRVIVVDNNSTDKTAEIAGRYPFVTIIKEARQGRAYARNAGYNAVTTDIIARTDADMVLPPDWVEHIHRFYADPAHQSYVWTSVGDFTNVRLRTYSNSVLRWFCFTLNRGMLGHNMLWGSSTALLRSQWQTVSSSMCLADTIHEDLDLSIHLAARGYRIWLDYSIAPPATIRRLNHNRQTLWRHLRMWPQTLRIHRIPSWPVIYAGIIVIRFGFVPTYVALDALARAVGRPAFAE